MKIVRLKYMFLLMFAFLFANLFYINVSEVRAEENVDLSNAYIGEITNRYWALVNYGEDFIASENVTIFLSPDAIADTRINYILIAETDLKTGKIHNTHYQRGVDSSFASRFNYRFVNSDYGDKNIVIFLLTSLGNDATDIIDRININRMKKVRTIKDLTSADFVISQEVEEMTSTPYKVYVSIKENPEDYILKEVKYSYEHKNLDGSTSTVTGSAIYDPDNYRYYFTVSENSIYHVTIEDHFGYVKPDEGDELSIEITNFYGAHLILIAEYDDSLTNSTVNVHIKVFDSEGREYEHYQIDILRYDYLSGDEDNPDLKNLGVFAAKDNGIYVVYCKVKTMEATLEVNITNIDRIYPTVIVPDVIEINTSDVEKSPYAFDPMAQVIATDNATLGDSLFTHPDTGAKYYYISPADNTCKIAMSDDEIPYNIYDYLYSFNNVCVIYFVSDEAGNIARAISRINVVDNTKPTIINGVDEIILQIGDEKPTDEELKRRFGLILGDNSLKHNPERIDEMTINANFNSVDFTELNRYPVYISSIDASGNVSDPLTLTVVVTERILVVDAVANQYIVYGEPMIEILYTCNGNPCRGDIENSEILPEDWDKLTGEMYIASGARYSGTYEIYSNLEINSRKYRLVKGVYGVFTIKPRTFKIVAHSYEIDYRDSQPTLTWYMDTSVCNPDLSTKYTSFDMMNYSCTFVDGDSFGGGAVYKYTDENGFAVYEGGIVREKGDIVKYDAHGNVTFYQIWKDYQGKEGYENNTAGLKVNEVSNGGRDNYAFDFYGLYGGIEYPGYARFYIWPKYVEIKFSDVNKIYGEADPSVVYQNNTIDADGNPLIYEGAKRSDGKSNVQYEFTCFAYKEPIKSMNEMQCQEEILMYITREAGETVGKYRIIGMWHNLNYDVRFNETLDPTPIDSVYLNILHRDIEVMVDGKIDEDGNKTGKYDIFYEDPLPNVTLSITNTALHEGLAHGSYVNINDLDTIISFKDNTYLGNHPIKYLDSDGNEINVKVDGLYDEYVPGAGVYTITRDTFTIVDKDGNVAIDNYRLNFVDGTLTVHQRLIYIKVVEEINNEKLNEKTYGDLDPVYTSSDIVGFDYYVIDGSGHFVLEIINTLNNANIAPGHYIPFDKDKLVYHMAREKEGFGISIHDVHYGEMVGEYLIKTNYFEQDDNYIIRMYPGAEYKFKISKRVANITINGSSIEFNYDNLVPKFSYRVSNLAFTDKLIGQPTLPPLTDEYRNNGVYQIRKDGIIALTSAPEISSVGNYYYINGEYSGVHIDDINLDLSLVTIVDGKYAFIDVDTNSIMQTEIEVKELDITTWNYDLKANNATLRVVAREVVIVPLDGYSKQYGDPDPMIGFSTYHYGDPNQRVEVIRRASDFVGALSREVGENPDSDPGYEINQGNLVPAAVGASTNFIIRGFEGGHYFEILKRTLIIVNVQAYHNNNIIEVEYGYAALESIVSGYQAIEGSPAIIGDTNPQKYCTQEIIDGQSVCDPIKDIISGSIGTRPENPRDVGVYRIVNKDLKMVRAATGIDVTKYYHLRFVESILDIKAREITIMPEPGQWKYYGELLETDPTTQCEVIKYTYAPHLVYGDVESAIKRGCLQRVENTFEGIKTRELVGSYSINNEGPNPLSFGPNYHLTVVGSITYEILPRPITIIANVSGEDVGKIQGKNSYVMSYGDDFDIGYEISVDSGLGLANNAKLGIFDRVVNNVALYDPDERRYIDIQNEDVGIGDYLVVQGTLYITNQFNYDVTFVDATFNVNKKEIVIQPWDTCLSKIYGDDDPEFGFDFISDPAPYTGKLTRIPGELVGIYSFLPTDPESDGLDFGENYSVSFDRPSEAVFEIIARKVFIKAENKEMLFGTPKEEEPKLTYTCDVEGDFVCEDLPIITGELVVNHNGLVGEYPIEDGGLTISTNYSIEYTPGIFKIKYADITSISIRSLTNNQHQVQGQENPTVRLYAEFNRGANPIYLNDVVWSVVKNGNNVIDFERDLNNVIEFTPSGSLGTYVVSATYNGLVATYEVYVRTSDVSDIFIHIDPRSNPNQKLGEETNVTYTADVHLYEDFDGDFDNIYILWYAGNTVVCNHALKGEFDTCTFNPSVISNDYKERIGTHEVYAVISEIISNKLDLTIRDNEAPKITLDGDLVIYKEVFQNATENSTKFSEEDEGGYKAEDDVEGDLTYKVRVLQEIDYYKVGTYYIIYEVRDSHGHIANNYRTIIVQDTVAPVVTLNNPELSTLTIQYGDEYVEYGATAYDAYDAYYNNELRVYIDNGVNINKVGTYQVVYFAIDSNGLRGQVIRTVKIIDTIKPTITLIGDSTIHVEYGEVYKDSGAWFEDNYDGKFRIYATTIIFRPPGTNESVEVSSVDTNILGRYELTYYQTDSSDNPPENIPTRAVIVQDTTPPVITLKGSNPYILRYGDTYVEPGYTVIDNYDGDITNNSMQVTVREVIGNTLGAYYVYYNAIDTNKNPAKEVIREVVILDLISPIIYFTESCPQYITLEALVDSYNSNCDLPGLGYRVYDDYTPDIDLIQGWVEVNGSVDITTIGRYEITYDVSDRSGNKAIQLVRYVDVVDTIAPTLTLKPNAEGDVDFYVEVFSEYEEPGWEVSDIYDDYHDIEINVEVINNVNMNKLNTYTIIYTATDSSGNQSEPVARLITVRDSIPPVVTLIGDETIILERGHTKYYEYGATAVDNYDGKITNISISATPTGYNIGTFPVEYCATDSSGNVGCTTRTVIVDDTIAPTVLGPEDGGYYRGALYIYYAPLTNTDEILTGILNGEPISSPWYVSQEGAYHLEVNDDAGNITIIDFSIDTTAPNLYGANDGEYINHPVTIYSDELLKNITYRVDGGGYIDYDGQRVLFDTEGEYVVYATDMAGNTTQSRPIRFIIDLTPPEYSLEGVLNGGITNTDVTLVTEPEAIVSVNNQYISTSHIFSENGYYRVTIRDKAGNDVYLQFVINKDPVVKINNKDVEFISQNNAIGEFVFKASPSYPKGVGFIYAKPLLEGGFEYISGTLLSDEEYKKLIGGEDLTFAVPSVSSEEMVVAFVVNLDELNKFVTQTVEGDGDSAIYYTFVAIGGIGLVGGMFYFFIVVKRKKDEEEEEVEEIIDEDNYY